MTAATTTGSPGQPRPVDGAPHPGRALPRPADVLPHRPPFLLVDRLEELDVGRRAVAVWTPRASAGWFEGHFPGAPILPGVLLVEAMAQTGAIAVLADPVHRDKLPLFAGIEKARFRRPVRPDEEVRLEVTLLQLKGLAGRGQARAWVGDKLAAEAELMFMLVQATDPRSPRLQAREGNT